MFGECLESCLVSSVQLSEYTAERGGHEKFIRKDTGEPIGFVFVEELGSPLDSFLEGLVDDFGVCFDSHKCLPGEELSDSGSLFDFQPLIPDPSPLTL